MKTLDIGELVNSNYGRDEVIAYVARQLSEQSMALIKAMEKQNWGEVGAITTAISTTASIAKALDKKVNGKNTGIIV